MGKSEKRASLPPGSGENGLLDQMRVVAEAALKDVQKRLPPDLVKQVEKAVGRSQTTLKAIQAQLETTARRADVDRLTKRVDDLAKQFEQLVAARSAGTTAAEPAPGKGATDGDLPAAEVAAAKAPAKSSSSKGSSGKGAAAVATKPASRTAAAKTATKPATSKATTAKSTAAKPAAAKASARRSTATRPAATASAQVESAPESPSTAS